jgi:hypothetical protein
MQGRHQNQNPSEALQQGTSPGMASTGSGSASEATAGSASLGRSSPGLPPYVASKGSGFALEAVVGSGSLASSPGLPPSVGGSAESEPPRKRILKPPVLLDASPLQKLLLAKLPRSPPLQTLLPGLPQNLPPLWNLLVCLPPQLSLLQKPSLLKVPNLPPLPTLLLWTLVKPPLLQRFPLWRPFKEPFLLGEVPILPPLQTLLPRKVLKLPFPVGGERPETSPSANTPGGAPAEPAGPADASSEGAVHAAPSANAPAGAVIEGGVSVGELQIFPLLPTLLPGKLFKLAPLQTRLLGLRLKAAFLFGMLQKCPLLPK